MVSSARLSIRLHRVQCKRGPPTGVITGGEGVARGGAVGSGSPCLCCVAGLGLQGAGASRMAMARARAGHRQVSCRGKPHWRPAWLRLVRRAGHLPSTGYGSSAGQVTCRPQATVPPPGRSPAVHRLRLPRRAGHLPSTGYGSSAGQVTCPPQGFGSPPGRSPALHMASARPRGRSPALHMATARPEGRSPARKRAARRSKGSSPALLDWQPPLKSRCPACPGPLTGRLSA